MGDYLDDAELERLKVPELKDYLKTYGQYVSGKKEELLVRAKDVRILGLISVESNLATDQQTNKQRSQDKLVTSLGENIPDVKSLKDWSNDLSLVPEFSDSDVYNYLVLTMKAKRQLKSRIFLQDRHVHGIMYHPVSDECSHCLIKNRVVPFLPTTNKIENPDYHVWACLSKVTGNVHSADCTCTAGLGEACNHIGALLHALLDITDKKNDGLLASTSAKCVWNNPRKRKLSPKKSQDMSFGKTSNSPSSTTTTGTTNTICNPTVNEERFRKRLLEIKSKAGWLTNFERDERSNVESISCVLDNVHFMYRDTVDLQSEHVMNVFEEFFKELKVTKDQCRAIVSSSRGQSNNKIWSSQRVGRITSSNFCSIVIRKESTPPENLVKSLFGYSSFDNHFVKWGRDHEPAARKMYELLKKREMPEFSVLQCGLIVDPKYPHLGASPDGMIFDPSEKSQFDLLEIKCPASESWKNLTPAYCAKDTNFFCELSENGDIHLKHSHSYYYQVRGQMGITGRKWCDFVVWTLKKPPTIERIYLTTIYGNPW